MKKIMLFFALLNYGSSASAMLNAQVGDTITWHTRQYKVTSRTDIPDSQIHITMERPALVLCELPLSMEQITCTHEPGQNNWTANFTQQHTITPTGWVVLASSLFTVYKLTKYFVN